MHSIRSEKISFLPVTLVLFFITTILVFLGSYFLLKDVAGYGSAINRLMDVNMAVFGSGLGILFCGIFIGRKKTKYLH